MSTRNYDLENRTQAFAKAVRDFIRYVPQSVWNIDDCKQVVRSSGSVGANYIEANEATSLKDFRYRIKICKKEAKETRYWLQIIDCSSEQDLQQKHKILLDEVIQLERIFGAIHRNIDLPKRGNHFDH